MLSPRRRLTSCERERRRTWSSCRCTLRRTCCRTVGCGRPRCPSSSRTCAATAPATAVLLWVQAGQRGNTQNRNQAGQIREPPGRLLSTCIHALIRCLWTFPPDQSSSLLGKVCATLAVTAIADPLWFSLSSRYYHFESARATIHALNVISPSLSSGVTALQISSGWQLSRWTKMSNISQNDWTRWQAN